VRIFVFALASVIAGNAVLAQQQCTYSFWTWQGGERVRVCCNQRDFCVTKFGIYSQ